MADRETVSRIAKILARTGSDNQNEAQAALHGAYKRMKHDGVTLADLLALPLQELYQEALVKLVGLIVAEQENLSPDSKRTLFAEYMRLIVERFSGESDKDRFQEETARQQQERSREEEARRYEEARRRQEAERNRESARPEPNSESRPKPDAPDRDSVTVQLGRFTFSFSLAAFFSAIQASFGRGSFAWNAFRNPGRALQLGAASILFGIAFAGVVLLVAAVLHSVTGTRPFWDVRLKDAFSFLVALGFFLKAQMLYQEGWFSRF